MITNQLAIVNGVKIQISNDREKLVPIKPICEALGINYTTQVEKLKNDSILSSVVPLRGITASDGKTYQMICIPLQYVFGWLFTISDKNVSEEAKELVIRYKKECYDVLFKYFNENAEFVVDRAERVENQERIVNDLQLQVKSLKVTLKENLNKLSELKSLTINQWKNENSQLKLELYVNED